ncbi:aldolase [Candidatus Woesearchaeota archaeon]|nr:aldolase [Candidatus Woesearchaeota archaeon]
MKIAAKDVNVPADVPKEMKAEYVKNYLRATRNTGRLMLFAGDQKIEHLNDDFTGKTKEGMKISEDDAAPEHFFRIASKGAIGVFAGQLGLIARYAQDYKNVAYLIKMNSKSPLVKTKQSDPVSESLVDFEDVLNLKANGVNVVGIGYTIYLGSEFENTMFSEAGRLATWAHQNGLVAIFWMYPRGKAVAEEKDPHLIAGAAGVALCLGADFAKVNFPEKGGMSLSERAESFKEAIKAAGRTKVITAGGSAKDPRAFLQETHDQIHASGAMGNATGRNIHQRPLDEAVRMCDAISAITLGDKDVEFAYKVYEGKEKFALR